MDSTPNKGSKNHMEKNEEHILALEEKNQQRKMIAGKSTREKKEEVRVNDFTTHFAGANSSRPVIAKPMVKTNYSTKPIVHVKGESRKGWAIEPRGALKVGRSGLAVGDGLNGLGSVSPIMYPDTSQLGGVRRSREAMEVDEDDLFASSVGDESEVSEEDEEEVDLEDSLDEAYHGHRARRMHTGSSRYGAQQDFDEEEEEDELYDEDFEDDDDTQDRSRQHNDIGDAVEYRPSRRGTGPKALDAHLRGVAEVGMVKPIELEVPTVVRHTLSASGELNALRVQCREANTASDPCGESGAKLPEGVTPSVGEPGVASDIAARLQTLSRDQQSKLLMMLNTLESASDLDDMGISLLAAKPASAAPPPMMLSPNSDPSTEPKSALETSNVEVINDVSPSSFFSPAHSPCKKNRTKRSPRRKKNSPAHPASGAHKAASRSLEQCDNVAPASQKSHEVSFDPECASVFDCPIVNDTTPPGTNVTIRIKLHNSWKKTTFASLASLRLLLRGSDEEVDLSDFTVQVSTGNMVHPKSSEVARDVSYLFARSRVAERKEWHFPVGSTFQLVLTGHIQGFVEDYELLVWNGVSDATCSPVRDVDVYANNTLVWTGEINDNPCSGGLDEMLQPGFGIAPSARHREYTSRALLTAHGVPRPPSNVIPLRTQFSSSKRETVPSPVSPIVKPKSKQSQPEETESTRSGAFTFSVPTTDSLTLEHGAGRGGTFAGGTVDEPSWLTDLKTPRDGPLPTRSSTDINFVDSSQLKHSMAPERTKSAAGRDTAQLSKSQDLYFAGEDQTIAAAGSSRPDSRHNAASTRGYAQGRSDSQELSNEERKPYSRGSRRKAREQQMEEAAVQPMTTTTTTPFKPRKSRREAKKEEEERLRQSMEALNASDRHNRGRLEQELTTAGGGRHEQMEGSVLRPMPKITESDENAQTASGADVGPLSLESTVAVNLTTRRMKALEGLSGGALDKELMADSGESKVIRQRSDRIDQVQEKVSSALASLAGVMSTLPSQNMKPPEHAKLHLSTNPNPVSTSGPAYTSDPTDTARIAALDGGIDDLLAESYLESSVCDIPVLPRGRIMELEVLSTWGDPYYVGLNGIDVFDHHGDIQLQNEGIDAIVADPSDINILPEYHDDPRTIHNVLDGMNFTRDDLHVWLAPHGHTLSPRLPYVANITITFSIFTTVSLIRIWNYNKSRTHCYRGVRRCRLRLDNKVVFEGEIRAAPGLATCTEDCSEVILFTTDSMVLRKVAAYDMAMGYMSADMSEEQSSSKWLEQLKDQRAYSRPRTADKSTGRDGGDSAVLTRRKQATSTPNGAFEPSQSRPTTAAIRPVEQNCRSVLLSADMRSTAAPAMPTRPPPELAHAEPLPPPVADNVTMLRKCDLFECRFLSFVIERTWGDRCYVGLAGLEVLIGQNALATEVDASMIDAEPRDLSMIGCFDDPRTPDKLVDGVNNTTDDTHMWLIPYTAGTNHQVKIDLGTTCCVAGFNVWNYNKSPEDALRGARVVAVYADGQLVGRCEVRIAPGCDGVNTQQTVMLRDITDNAIFVRPQGGLRYIAPAVRQDYETPVLPSGTTWRFNLYCNWGDGYYIGLDGLQMLDENGKEILLESSHCRLAASPSSLCELGMLDSRLPRNLSCQPHSDPTGCMAWLTPLAQCMTGEERRSSLRFTVGRADCDGFEPLFYDQNVLHVFFNRPVTVSVVRFFNYSKTPKRGVREIGIDVDGDIVFMGTLRSADSQGYNPSEGQAVVFTSDPKLVKTEKSKVIYCGGREQDVLCINERQVIVRSKAMYEQPNVSMEGIHSDLSNR